MAIPVGNPFATRVLSTALVLIAAMSSCSRSPAGEHTCIATGGQAILLDATVFAVIVGKDLEIRSLPESKLLQTFEIGSNGIPALSISADHKSLFLGDVVDRGDGISQAQLSRLSIASGELVWSCDTLSELMTVAVSPNGETVAVGGGHSPAAGNGPHAGAIELIDAADGSRKATLRGRSKCAVQAIAFSNDGHQLAVGHAEDAAIALWDIDSKTEHVLFQTTPRSGVEFSGVFAGITALRFSQDDRILVAGGQCQYYQSTQSACGGGVLLAWNTDDHRMLLAHSKAEAVYTSITYSGEDEVFLATAGDCADFSYKRPATSYISGWDLSSLTQRWEMIQPGTFVSASVLPDKKAFVAVELLTDTPETTKKSKICRWPYPPREEQ